MSELTTLASAASQAELIEVIERDGGVIVRDLIPPDTLARLNADLDGFVEACEPGSRDPGPIWQVFHGRNTKRFCGLAAKSKAFLDVLLDPTLEAYGDHFLLPSCGSYWLNTTQMMVIGPGEPAQLLHRDEANWPHFPWPGPEVTMSVMFALSDFTRDNGATVVAPGSHRWGDPAERPSLEELTQAVMPAGSGLLYSGKVIHGAGENRTDGEWRRGMHVSFVLGWLRPEENHYLAVPLEVARGLPERARRLLGYTSYQPSGFGGRLGLVDFDEAELTVRH